MLNYDVIKRKARYAVIIIAVIIAIFNVVGTGHLTREAAGQDENFKMLDEEVYSSVLRFHVLANSDSDEDQRAKLRVKDVVAEKLAKDMKEAGINSKEQAQEYVNENMNRYIEMAGSVLKEEGYSYGVRGELTNCWFPVKVYGNCVFPEGNYDAFRILIGKAEGKNWWCVLFPSLCMVDEAYMVADMELGDGADNSDTGSDKDNMNDVGKEMKFRLRIVEWLQDMW